MAGDAAPESPTTEEGFRSLVEAIRDYAILRLDPEGVIRTWSPGAEELFQYSAREATGCPLSLLFLPEADQQAFAAAELRDARLHGRADSTGWRRRRDGTRFWGNGVLTAMRDGTGAVIGFAKVTRDISVRREVEENRSRLVTVLEASPDFVGICDREGRPLFINRAGRQLLGLGADEPLQDRGILDFHPPHAHEDLRAAIEESRREGSWEGQSTILSRDGIEIPVSLSIVSHPGEDGSVRFFSTIMRDLRARLLLEAKLRQAQKMESIGLLAGGVAHDFNNLLTVISGYSEVLLAGFPRGSAAHEHLLAIADAGARAAALTRQLLAFSRQTVLEPTVLSVNEVVVESERLLRRILGEDVELACVLDPAVPRVLVDKGHLGQVLMNLAVNARDAMPRGGRLTIETGEVELDGSYCHSHVEVQPGRFVRIAVSDTGTGMPPAIAERIFEPFFTTKEVGHGTGLGLATVHGIVKQSGGSIEVYTEEGVGTTFKVYLPAEEGTAGSPDADVDQRELRGNEVVLLVEDEGAVRELAILSLRTRGYRVLPASSGEAALRLVEQHEGAIDLLLTDVVMPRMGGRQVADAVRERYPGMKVLFMSGYTDDTVVRHGILHAEVAFLQKPFTPLSLLRKVRRVLDGR